MISLNLSQLIATRAAAHGSTAATLRGQIRAARKPLPATMPAAILQALDGYACGAAPRDDFRRVGFHWPNFSDLARTPRAKRFSQKDRDARRAEHDPIFLRWLNRRPADIAAVPAWQARRAAARPLCAKISADHIAGTALLSVSALDAERYGVQVVRRGENWAVEPSYAGSHFFHSDGETEWKNGRPISYTRATNTTYIRAYAIVASRRLHAIIHTEQFRLRAPAGYRWKIDALGVALCDINDDRADYHFSASELVAGTRDEFLSMIAALELNRAARIAAAEAVEQKNHLAMLAKKHAGTAYICARDSVRAGNCGAGTIKWAEQRGLDARRHYPVRAVARLENNNDRLALAIRSATMRHAREIMAGVCVLADHA